MECQLAKPRVISPYATTLPLRPGQTALNPARKACHALWPASGVMFSPMTDWQSHLNLTVRLPVPSTSAPSQDGSKLCLSTGKPTVPTRTWPDCRLAMRSARGCVASRVEVVPIVPARRTGGSLRPSIFNSAPKYQHPGTISHVPKRAKTKKEEKQAGIGSLATCPISPKTPRAIT